MRILVVEDERELRKLTTKRLVEEGYSVDACEDGEDALQYLAMAEYDAVILDILLPKVDGLSVLRTMRQQKNRTPVLLLTAKGAVEDKVEGLNSGADDYLAKPFSYDELLARIRVMLRRQAVDTAENILTLADLTLDLNTRVARRGNKVLHLTQKEYALLEYLLHNKGIVL